MSKLSLADSVGEFFFDPYSYVLFNYPWGQPGPLENWEGPDEWQTEVLQYIGEAMKSATTAVKVGIAAGHGVGKSALMSWLTQWWMDTRTEPKAICTAGTKTQLQTKLWPELSLWHKRSLTRDWTDWYATSLRHKISPDEHRADAIPWSAENPDAFQGAHSTHMMGDFNLGGVLLEFDEASTIHEKIWEAVEGALTDLGALWVAFGNPVRSSGMFYNIFNHPTISRNWKTFAVDARRCRMPNKEQHREWEETYGEDSDFFRVRVRGQFPRVSSMQLIPTDDWNRATNNMHAQSDESSARVLGVDVARFGDDSSIICKRQGNIIWPLLEYRKLDTMALAQNVAREIDDWNPDTTFVDGVGIGAGVVDRLRQLGYDVVDVQAGASAEEDQVYSNKRTEMAVRVRDWLKGDVRVPSDDPLKEEAIGVEYGFVNEKRMALERKKDFKDRLGRSPDRFDAVALTFAEPVRPRRHMQAFRAKEGSGTINRDWRLMRVCHCFMKFRTWAHAAMSCFRHIVSTQPALTSRPRSMQ